MGATSSGDAGSSPLTRGKRRQPRWAVGACGLIPAHAGKTSIRRCINVCKGAHPRSRGENSVKHTRLLSFKGSSPLTRGKPRTVRASRPRRGLIPAHAGKTSMRMASRGRSGAHPRSRGENFGPISGRGDEPGSSPLTRGKPWSEDVLPLRYGLIPAHAGKTAASGRSRPAYGAHPRSRGENATTTVGMRRAGGSSPLTRGKHNLTIAIVVKAGLIPAHAGKTLARPRRLCAFRAHPRSRGENIQSVMGLG